MKCPYCGGAMSIVLGYSTTERAAYVCPHPVGQLRTCGSTVTR